jgi:MarR family transcriptional regulator, lower aerobic nicotinate degradation pathway regulator
MPRPQRAPFPLLAMPTYAISLLGRDARLRMAEALPDGLRLGHLAVLGALAEQSGQPQGALAEMLAIHPTDVVGIIDDLLERELVGRHIDPKDRRRKLVHITVRGRRLVTGATAASEEIMNQVLFALAEDNRKTVIALLRQALQPETADAAGPNPAAPVAGPVAEARGPGSAPRS